MASSTPTLRDRIDTCLKKKAALEERRTRAEQDLKAAEDALKELGLTPKTAKAAIDKEEADLTREIEEVEGQLGIKS